MHQVPALEPEQKQLFIQLVEAWRSTPRAERHPFTYIPTMGAELVQGNGLNVTVLGTDIQVLVDSGLIRVQQYATRGSGFSFYTPPESFNVYQALKQEEGAPPEQVETDVRRYLDNENFQETYPAAYARWREATDLLWQTDDAERELSTIGHKCREAVQEFVTALIEKHNVTGANPDRAKTRDRLSAVVRAHRPDLSGARSELLDALFGYWKAAGDLIQRQEHAGQREGEPLTWEDGRRVVFQTAIVMFEIDRTL
jgi:hypothetical protein